MIDLRSDTVTRPTPAMRQAMAEADVGDDVFGEDPTVNRLQDTVAELLGKDAALFVPSGVMGNQLGLKVHTNPGDEVIVERQCHIFNYESGAPGLLSGVQLHVVDGTKGICTPETIEAAIRPGYYWEAPSRLLCLENTINKAGGVVYPLERLQALAELAHEHDLSTHLDGARLWNASAASGIPERDYAAPFDTISVCLSKGLGAPVGSLIVGSDALIEQAHRYRKLFGGGMRQVGVLAAAGLHALDQHRPRLAEDHAKARRLAEGIADLDAFSIDLDTVETNIVMFDVVDGPAQPVLESLREDDVYMVPFGPSTIRATTHLDVTMDDIDDVVSVMRRRFGRRITA
ncbi:MAG: aminotransferase class I/II-fold pyridoxal phosphate-dependent enzyme [Bacteroidetes bacterium]|jgi:threonine aldolase|nr:aminotransferase class I/II-fold pyridoxal phosphate-dependent enzyme [Bacteroidota bacterium]